MTMMEPGDDLPTAGSPSFGFDDPGSQQVAEPAVRIRWTSEQVAAFGAFYRTDVARLVAFLRWQGASLSEAADAAQEAMTKAYERWDTLARPGAWVRTVATKEFIRRRTRSREDPVTSLPEAHSSLLRDGDVVAQKVTEQGEELRVLQLLDRLPARQRQVMAWTYDGYAPKEIASQLGTTSDAVRSNLHLARRCLTELLGSDVVGPGRDQR
jgi:RNA polymerase sigma-70 factor (ECF subfamily)